MERNYNPKVFLKGTLHQSAKLTPEDLTKIAELFPLMRPQGKLKASDTTPYITQAELALRFSVSDRKIRKLLKEWRETGKLADGSSDISWG